MRSSVELVLDLSGREKAKYAAQRAIVRVATHTPLRTDEPLREGSPGRISHETKEKMGVKPLKIHAPYTANKDFPAHKALVEGIQGTAGETGAEVVDSLDDANVIFMHGSETEGLPGMLAVAGAYHKGVNGVAIPPARDEDEEQATTHSLWRTLGHSGTKYSLRPVVDEGRYVGFDLGSMEGAQHYADVRDGYLDLTERLGYMAASEYVTKNMYEETGEELSPNETPLPMIQVMQMCRALEQFKFMPKLDIRKIVPAERADLLMRFMGQSGLSTGNASFWDQGSNRMFITASGVDKGSLQRDEVLRVKKFTPTFDGVVIDPYTIDGRVRKPRISVEAFGNLGIYLTSLGIESGYITDGSLDQILNFIQDEELVQYELNNGRQPRYIRQLHFHAHPQAWNPELVDVVEVNNNLVHGGNSHASCGTRPEAYYTMEMAGRGMVENKDARRPKIIIAKMQEHGSEVVSPFDLETTLDILNPYKAFPDVFFAPVHK